MDCDDTLDLIYVTLLLNEAHKCLNIITEYEEEDVIEANDDTRTSVSPEREKVGSDYTTDKEDESAEEESESDNDNDDHMFQSYYEKICHKNLDEFKTTVNMSMEVFNFLYKLVKRNLRRYARKQVISAKCQLFVTLVYLANGGAQTMLASLFDLAKSTLQKWLNLTCKAICTSLCDKYLSNEQEPDWSDIAEHFNTQWHAPNCVGAIDIKVIELRCPRKDSQSVIKKKGKYSFAVLGACNANYMFTGYDFAILGLKKEKETWNTGFEKKLFDCQLNLPEEKKLPNSNIEFPHYFIGDMIYPLKAHIMRPYPGRNMPVSRELFNTRLNRTRQIIDNTFGVWIARWKILSSPLILSPSNMENILKATLLLHNFAQTHESAYITLGYVDRYEGDTLIPGKWRDEVKTLPRTKRIHSNNATHAAFKLRDTLCEYIERNPIT